MSELAKDLERRDAEEFIREVLMKVPKGQGRDIVLAVTGAAASIVAVQHQNNTGNSPVST